MSETGERCPACNANVVDAGVAPGGSLRCDRCGTRFPKAKARPVGVGATGGRDEEGLGIHPALAKKYTAALPQAPKPQVPHLREQGRVVQGGVPSAEGAAVDARDDGTAPARPAARNSMGAPAADGLRANSMPAPPPQVKPPSPTEPLPQIPGFHVMELIGKGAMGRVYRAQHLQSGRMAAIKTLAPELAVRPDFVARFEREGAAMRAVRHPGVVQVWDQGKAGADIYYIAMEFIEGHPLRKFLERGPLAPAFALRYTRLILQALQAAHSPGVIHRDLKPENILMHGPAGMEKPVLVDFGLAGIMEEENDPHPNLTKSRMTMGTVNYMAPEQRTDAKRVDQRADLYAAGVILYELLTGDLPLGRFALPTEKGLNVPASVDRLIIKALARNAEERFQHARDFDAAVAVIENEIRPPKAVVDDVADRDTLSPNDTLPGRPAAPGPAGSARGPLGPLRRESSEPGAARLPSLTPSSVSLSPTGAAATTVESLAPSFLQGAAWATMLPQVQMKTIGGVAALLVGTLLGLLLLRGL